MNLLLDVAVVVNVGIVGCYSQYIYLLVVILLHQRKRVIPHICRKCRYFNFILAVVD